MFLLSLLAALSGSPLRQAEAAHDLARSIEEIDEGSLVEEEDGGVGDDTHEALKAVDGTASTIGDVLADGFLPGSPIDLSVGLPIAIPADRPRSVPPPDPSRRLAWLQSFRC